VYLHVQDNVFNPEGGIDPMKIDQVARLGGPWYTRANQGLFKLPQPTKPLVGIDQLPEAIRTSSVLTGRDLAKLATIEELPGISASVAEHKHAAAKQKLDSGDVEGAWRELAEN
jgi:hypothetical protein